MNFSKISQYGSKKASIIESLHKMTKKPFEERSLLYQAFVFPEKGTTFRFKKESPLKQPLGQLKIVLLLITLFLNLYYVSDCNSISRFLCGVYGTVFILRILIQICFFWNRTIIPYEVFTECVILIPSSLISIAYLTKNNHAISNIAILISVLIFSFGIYLNLYSEMQRHFWKKTNPNRMYSQGLFQYSRHINYLGESVSFVGYGLISGQLLGLWVAALMTFGFIKASIPEVEFYLEKRYGKEHDDYVKQVPWKLVPYIF